MAMTDETEARENIAFGRAIQRDAADRLVQIPDALTRYRAEADAAQAAERAETQRRIREAKRDQRERELRRAMVEADIDGRIAALTEAIGQVVAEERKAYRRQFATLEARWSKRSDTMPLNEQIIEARIALRVAELRELAAWTFVALDRLRPVPCLACGATARPGGDMAPRPRTSMLTPRGARHRQRAS
jgi:hypothetical protein